MSTQYSVAIGNSILTPCYGAIGLYTIRVTGLEWARSGDGWVDTLTAAIVLRDNNHQWILIQYDDVVLDADSQRALEAERDRLTLIAVDHRVRGFHAEAVKVGPRHWLGDRMATILAIGSLFDLPMDISRLIMMNFARQSAYRPLRIRSCGDCDQCRAAATQ